MQPRELNTACQQPIAFDSKHSLASGCQAHTQVGILILKPSIDQQFQTFFARQVDFNCCHRRSELFMSATQVPSSCFDKLYRIGIIRIGNQTLLIG